MEFFGISIFDLVVLGILSFAALMGLATGFVRACVFVGSWFLAVIAGLYFYPQAAELAGRFFRQDWIISAVAGLGPFLITLIVLNIVGQVLARRVRQGGLKGLDRGLGLLAGLAIGASIVAVAYLPLDGYFTDNEKPEWIRDARSLPHVERLAGWARDIVPPDLLNRPVEALGGVTGRDGDAVDPADVPQPVGVDGSR